MVDWNYSNFPLDKKAQCENEKAQMGDWPTYLWSRQGAC